MNKSWIDSDSEVRKGSELNRIRKIAKQAETLRIKKDGCASSKWAEKGAWLTYAGRVVSENDARGYKAITASITFTPYTQKKGINHRIDKRQAEYIANAVLSAFDDMYGGRRGKQIKRLVFRHAGALGDNNHYHITFFVHPSWDLDEFYRRWDDAKRKVIRKALAGGYADSMLYKRNNEWCSTFECLSVGTSICEAERENGRYAIYSAHEVRETLDSYEALLSVE